MIGDIISLITSLLFIIFFNRTVEFKDRLISILMNVLLLIPILGQIFGIIFSGFLSFIAYNCDYKNDAVSIKTNSFTKWLMSGAYENNGEYWYNPKEKDDE